MRFKLYREFGALNSPPVFDAIQTAINRTGHQEVAYNEDVSVIWSVLWHGRMQPNQKIYERNQKEGRHTLILEVGNFKRGHTWRLSIGHVNRFGIFGNCGNLDSTRLDKLGISLRQEQTIRRDEILIACQHDKSLQWKGQPSMHEWVNQTVNKLRQYTDRPVVVRPHPRCLLKGSIIGGVIEIPKKITNTYDDYDINYNYHSVINYNSGPCVQAAINGIPIICDSSSLAYEVSDVIENIEHIKLKQREEWLLRLAHTEWTVSELSSGEPLQRILFELS
jgi:hypothetical protein